jgi:hypothetical protein
MRIFGKEISATTLTLIAVAIVAIIGGVWYWKDSKKDPSDEKADEAAATSAGKGTTTAQNGKKGFAMAGVGDVFWN